LVDLSLRDLIASGYEHDWQSTAVAKIVVVVVVVVVLNSGVEVMWV
jgi:hypothetical protein